MPLPAPATVALLRGAKIVGVDDAVETVTPTAAALLAELAEDFGPIPPLQLTAVGYGAGTRLTPEPNVLRVLLGESTAGGGTETLVMLETNVDDMSPEVHGYVIERLLGAGALDAYLTPVLMKKGRPGVVISVLCRPDDAPHLRGLLFAETTTLGIRISEVKRECLAREIKTVEDALRRDGVKVARWARGAKKRLPEYEDCRGRGGVSCPLATAYQAALRAHAA